MVSQMMMDIENPEVRRITTIGGGKADIFMIKVPDEAKVAGKSRNSNQYRENHGRWILFFHNVYP